MDAFQGLPSNPVPLCLTASLKVPRSSVQTISMYVSINTMGPHSRHIAQEGDAFCFLEMNALWCEKCQSIPEQQQRNPVEMLEEKGTKVSISTVKRVLYRHNLEVAQQGRSHCSKNSQTTVCNCTWGQRLYFLEKCPLS